MICILIFSFCENSHAGPIWNWLKKGLWQVAGEYHTYDNTSTLGLTSQTQAVGGVLGFRQSPKRFSWYLEGHGLSLSGKETFKDGTVNTPLTFTGYSATGCLGLIVDLNKAQSTTGRRFSIGAAGAAEYLMLQLPDKVYTKLNKDESGFLYGFDVKFEYADNWGRVPVLFGIHYRDMTGQIVRVDQFKTSGTSITFGFQF